MSYSRFYSDPGSLRFTHISRNKDVQICQNVFDKMSMIREKHAIYQGMQFYQMTKRLPETIIGDSLHIGHETLIERSLRIEK